MLKKQRPQRRRDKFKKRLRGFFNFRTHPIFAIFLPLLFLGLVSIVIVTSRFSFSSQSILPNICDPAVKLSGNFSSQDLKTHLCKDNFDAFKPIQIKDLEVLVKIIQEHFAAESARASIVSPKDIYIKIIRRTPILKLMLGEQLFLVSDRLEVYAPKQISEKELNELIELDLSVKDFGFLSREPESNVVKLNEMQKQIIRQSEQLSQLMNAANLRQRKISYRLHRGFIIEKDQDLPEIVMGDEDFEERLKKLSSIYHEYGHSFSRIELDFSGKAFLIARPEKKEGTRL